MQAALDLAGPVTHRPYRNGARCKRYGPRVIAMQVISPAHVRITWATAAINESDTDPCLMVTSDKALAVRAGDTLRLRDARGSKRKHEGHRV